MPSTCRVCFLVPSLSNSKYYRATLSTLLEEIEDGSGSDSEPEQEEPKQVEDNLVAKSIPADAFRVMLSHLKQESIEQLITVLRHAQQSFSGSVFN